MPPYQTLRRWVHLKEMYNRQTAGWTFFHHSLPSSGSSCSTASNSSTGALAVTLHQQRIRQKFFNPGCTGQGHNNLQCWAEGHTTCSGCLIIHNVQPPCSVDRISVDGCPIPTPLPYTLILFYFIFLFVLLSSYLAAELMECDVTSVVLACKLLWCMHWRV